MLRFLTRTALLRYGPRLARAGWNAWKSRGAKRASAGRPAPGTRPAADIRSPQGAQPMQRDVPRS